jgi:hypothetical protein
VLRHLARKAHEIHEHCRKMMRDHWGASSARCAAR